MVRWKEGVETPGANSNEAGVRNARSSAFVAVDRPAVEEIFPTT
jgi:hypothetical protein